MDVKKSGFVSIIGRANVGKSTLINALVGEKVSIVTYHPQTTRDKILGILTENDYQIIFIDTPGIHKGKSMLSQYMNKNIRNALDGVDVILYVIAMDKKINSDDKKYLSSLDNKNSIVVLNKCDMVKQEDILQRIQEISEINKKLDKIYTISAKNNKNLDILKQGVVKLLPEGMQVYGDEYFTDKSVRFLISEIIREKTMQNLKDELPFGIAVTIEKIDESKKNITDVYASIICEKPQHKAMVIGKKGELLKKIATASRFEIERLLDKKVYLNLWVKVKENWRDLDSYIKSIGYDIKGDE